MTKRSNINTTYPQPDMRGRHQAWNKFAEEQLDDVRRHIESLPVLPAHYHRGESENLYADGNLNITSLFEDYKLCQEKNNKPTVKEWKYMEIINTECNIAFGKTKKDMCEKCVIFTNTMFPNEQEMQEHNKHLHDKDRARL